MAGKNKKPSALQKREKERPQLHISQLEINLTVQESPPVARELALQLLLRQRLELLLSDGVEVDFGQALADGVGDALVAGALGDEAGEIISGRGARVSCAGTVG